MAYDEQLAARVREALDGVERVSEKRMFGGLAFLIGGNLALTASHRGGLMLRVDPADASKLIAQTPATQIEMRGRSMPGWLYVEVANVTTKRSVARWVRLAVAHARSLPAKK